MKATLNMSAKINVIRELVIFARSRKQITSNESGHPLFCRQHKKLLHVSMLFACGQRARALLPLVQHSIIPI